MFILSLAKTLDAHQVDYAIVGGYAIALHGAVRGTIDVDLVINFSERDFIKAETVFKELGLESKLPLSAKQVFHFREEYIQNRNLIAWSFYSQKNPLHSVDVIITKDRRKIQVKEIPLGDVKLKIASIPDLIAMKSNTGRAQDRADVKALKELLK